MPPSGREGDHEVVEGECATAKFVLPMGIALSIHYRLVFRYVQTFFFRRLPQQFIASAIYCKALLPEGAKARPKVFEALQVCTNPPFPKEMCLPLWGRWRGVAVTKEVLCLYYISLT